MLYEAIRLGCDLYHKNEWSYNEAYGDYLRENATTILPRGRVLQGVGLSSMRFHRTGGGPEEDKDGIKCRLSSHYVVRLTVCRNTVTMAMISGWAGG